MDIKTLQTILNNFYTEETLFSYLKHHLNTVGDMLYPFHEKGEKWKEKHKCHPLLIKSYDKKKLPISPATCCRCCAERKPQHHKEMK